MKVKVRGVTYASGKEAILAWLASSPQNVDTFIAQVSDKLEKRK